MNSRWAIAIMALLTPGLAWAQAPAGAGGAAAGGTERYRLIERYAAGEPANPRELTQYRVAVRDALRIVTEKPQGTPDRIETNVQVIYSERPAQVNSSGIVTDAVRRYEALRISPTPEGTRPSAPRPLEGLSVWYKARPGTTPFVTALTPNHELTETEYSVSKQLVFMPDLASALPPLPTRVGERWRIPPAAARGLLGDRPSPGSEALSATLAEIRKADAGDDQVAVINITGHAPIGMMGVDMAVNARILFTFAPAQPGADGTVNALGAITELRLARGSVSAAPGDNPRLKRTFTWELTLQRQTSVDPATAAGVPIAVPTPSPIPTVGNSWLTYEDPLGRFHFRHPQDLLPQRDPVLEQEGVVQLIDDRAGLNEGRILTMRLQPKDVDSATKKQNQDPDFHLQELKAEWAKNKQDVQLGNNAWLPEAEWAPSKMRAHRIEAALKTKNPEGKAGTIYLDHYLILFTQDQSLAVDAMTGMDPPTPFRQQVEAILKTYTLGLAPARARRAPG